MPSTSETEEDTEAVSEEDIVVPSQLSRKLTPLLSAPISQREALKAFDAVKRRTDFSKCSEQQQLRFVAAHINGSNQKVKRKASIVSIPDSDLEVDARPALKRRSIAKRRDPSVELICPSRAVKSSQASNEIIQIDRSKVKGKTRAREPSLVEASPSRANRPSPAMTEKATQADHLRMLSTIFPDIDMDWASDLFAQPDFIKLTDASRGDAIAEHIFSLNGQYQKVVKAPVASTSARAEPVNTPAIDHFAAGREMFMHPSRIVSSYYQALSFELLLGEFPSVSKVDIRALHSRQHGRYAPCVFALLEDMKAAKPKYRTIQNPRPVSSRLVRITDKDLAREKNFVDKATAHEKAEAASLLAEKQRIETEKQAQDQRDENDRKNGRFLDCNICCADYAPRFMVQCEDGHLFCKDCVKTYVEGKVGDRIIKLDCMFDGGCDATYSNATLQAILNANTFALLENIRQQKAVEEAGLDNWESCPFCDFGYCQENALERLFYCHNENCKKISCRSCKFLEHLPKSCKEAEEARKTNTIHKVEEAMSEALIRKCPKCSQPYVKADGCNKMTCANCRALSCFICKKLITGYEHFDRLPAHAGAARNASSSTATAKCPLFDDTQLRTHQEVEQARKKAAQAVIDAHPDISQTELDRLKENVSVSSSPLED